MKLFKAPFTYLPPIPQNILPYTQYRKAWIACLAAMFFSLPKEDIVPLFEKMPGWKDENTEKNSPGQMEG